jgi:hypothetical protein
MTAFAEAPGEVQIPAATGLLQKLLEACREIGVVEKDSRNTFHKYDYTSIEGVVGAVRDPLLERGILLFAGQETITDRQRQTNQGEATVTTIELTFRFMDAETGEAIEIPWVGRGEDPADKGVSKALTDARKTFLIQQLNLVRGDDTEADPKTDNRGYGSPSGVNMTEAARGLTNAQLKRALVTAGLPEAEKPWVAYMNVPPAHTDALREALNRERVTT